MAIGKTPWYTKAMVMAGFVLGLLLVLGAFIPELGQAFTGGLFLLFLLGIFFLIRFVLNQWSITRKFNFGIGFTFIVLMGIIAAFILVPGLFDYITPFSVYPIQEVQSMIGNIGGMSITPIIP